MSPGVFIFLFIVVKCYSTFSVKCPGIAQYSLSFYGLWSNTTHPNAFPKNGHFSSLVGCSHDKFYTMWDEGTTASKGVKDVAELGISAVLENEIMQRIVNMYKVAWKLFKASGPTNNGTTHVTGIDVEVTQDFPLVSLVTRIAPSPDWFTGIKKIDLCDCSTGLWKDSWSIDMLVPWDAGTDSRNDFVAKVASTDPNGKIAMITKRSDTPFKNVPGANIPTLGKLMFQRQNKPNISHCSGKQTYNVTFEALWTKEIHPNGFPSNPHFSPLVGATHTHRYKVWSDMTWVSPGVKAVAETGNPTELYNEIKAMIKANFVYQAYKADGTTVSPGERSIEIMVEKQYSMVSLISMIAPSPDWFVGVDSLDLCGNDGKWMERVVKDLLPWDAGTDDGKEFTSPDISFIPHDFIRRITDKSDTVMEADALKPFASLTFEKMHHALSSRSSTLIPTSTILPNSTSSDKKSKLPTKTKKSAQNACCRVSIVVLVIAVIRGILAI